MIIIITAILIFLMKTLAAYNKKVFAIAGLDGRTIGAALISFSSG
jgi:hypothetical protein